jgi:ribonuclease T2
MFCHFVTRTRLGGLALALIALGVMAEGALAQRAPYRQWDSSGREARDRDGTVREHHPGDFDYYLLVLSWSPTYCADVGDERRDPQCSAGGRPYAFVLHGLWPQYERGWPSNCRSPDRGYVPGAVADHMLDIMPSRRLVFHEYRTHGTCSGLSVDAYFELARRLYAKVHIPSRLASPVDERMTIAPGELIGEFMAANPQLRPEMIAVVCGGAGNRLREVRICFDRAGALRVCGRNENQARLCAAERMYVPPVRMGANRGAPPDRRPLAPGDDLLPGPRER